MAALDQAVQHSPAPEAHETPQSRYEAPPLPEDVPEAPTPSLSRLQSEFAAAAFALPETAPATPAPEPAPAPALPAATLPVLARSAETRPAERDLFALVPYVPQQARNLGALLARLRAKAAEANPDLADKLMILVKEQSARGLDTSTRFAARSARRLAKAGQEIAHNLKASELKKNYQRMLAFAHARIVDRKLDTLLFIPTHIPGRQLALTTGSPVPAAAYEGPTPQLVYEWALAPLPQDLREYAFVDFRAARGRSLLLAARRNFEKIIGYEFDETSFDALSMNVAQYPRSLMTCRNVQCIRGDREGISIPDQPAVLFFSNAHREGQLSVALNHAMASHHRNPRSLYVILLNPGPTLPEGFDEIFAPVAQPLIDRVKFALLSPVKVAVYHSRP